MAVDRLAAITGSEEFADRRWRRQVLARRMLPV
jgi:hypothetical protein